MLFSVGLTVMSGFAFGFLTNDCRLIVPASWSHPAPPSRSIFVRVCVFVTTSATGEFWLPRSLELHAARGSMRVAAAIAIHRFVIVLSPSALPRFTLGPPDDSWSDEDQQFVVRRIDAVCLEQVSDDRYLVDE